MQPINERIEKQANESKNKFADFQSDHQEKAGVDEIRPEGRRQWVEATKASD